MSVMDQMLLVDPCKFLWHVDQIVDMGLPRIAWAEATFTQMVMMYFNKHIYMHFF